MTLHLSQQPKNGGCREQGLLGRFFFHSSVQKFGKYYLENAKRFSIVLAIPGYRPLITELCVK